jgi:hypothetical protein
MRRVAGDQSSPAIAHSHLSTVAVVRHNHQYGCSVWPRGNAANLGSFDERPLCATSGCSILIAGANILASLPHDRKDWYD